jgi:hypothetical protein
MGAYSSAWSFSTLAVPVAPTLVLPTNGATGTSMTPTLKWNAPAGGVNSYELQISTASVFATTVFDKAGLTATSRTISPALGSGTYYWRVSATNGGSAGVYSTPWSFTVTGFGKRLAFSFKVKSFSLSGSQNSISYELSEQCFVSVNYYDLKGRVIGSFINRIQGEGVYSLSLPMGTGIYVQDFKAGKFANRKMITITR